MLGRITGKATTLQFAFELFDTADVRKFEYVKVPHRVYQWVLCQVVEIEKSQDQTLAKCNVLGYKDSEGKVKQIRIPFDINTEVFLADDEFIRSVIELAAEDKGAYLGRLDGKDIPVRLDLSKLLTKHVAVLAKSGAGKSYAVGVLIEEILERKVPILIIDPHGEYGTLKEPSADKDGLAAYGLKPKKYVVHEYGDPKTPGLTPLRLSNNMSQQELVQLIPGKLNNTQLGIVYNAVKGIDHLDFDTLLLALEAEESSAKWAIINLVEHLRGLGIFSSNPLSYNELIKSGVCSTVNLRGIAPEIQEIVVYKLAKDLFELRKQNKVPPFFLVVEEAHNYCPERSFGESTSSKILRTIASEGRKFGLGLCVISQRPARVDKSVLSQCTTQVILKVTNPNDLKAVSSSVEGLTAESEAEIQNLPIGTALVTGVVDMPLFVNIRPRRTKHGGHAVDMLNQRAADDFLEQKARFEELAMIPVVKPKITPEELRLMSQKRVTETKTILIPAYLFTCQEKDVEYRVLVDMTNGEVVLDLDEYATARLPELDKLSGAQVKLLMAAHKLKRFTKDELVRKAGTTVEVDDDLKDLVEKGYLRRGEKEGSFQVTDAYLLSKLSGHACYAPITFEKVSATEQRVKTARLDTVKAHLARFTKVLDQQECHIIRYEVVT